MSSRFRNLVSTACLALALTACHNSHPDSNQTSEVTTAVTNPASQSDYQDFVLKFKSQTLPMALPLNTEEAKPLELDKKYIKAILSVNFTPAFGTEDILPALSDNIDGVKYFACGKVKLDSFSGYIVYKQGEDDYYYLCLFDRNGKFTDGMCIAFREGSNADGTIRESSINDDGSIEISQYNEAQGKPDREGAERHFYEITNQGKIRDLKSNAEPSHT